MRLKLQLCLTVAVVISCLVIGSGVRAQTATNTTTSGGTTIFPPTNQAAGSGVLFFPQGGNSSLYGIPSDDPALVAAVNDQTTQLVAAINVLTAAVKTLS